MKLSDDEKENITEHVVGTNMDDLTQIYNGRAIIKGSVNINHVLIFHNHDQFIDKPIQFDPDVNQDVFTEEIVENKIIVNGMNFDLLNISQQFWMKNIDQV